IFPELLLGLAILGSASGLKAKQKIGYKDQLLLIGGLDHEVAVAKIALPSGKQGVHIMANGQIDEAAATKQLREKGESVKPGMPVEITEIKFKPGRIFLAINGGGKNGQHWYDHLQLGMGPFPVPVVSSQQQSPASIGSYITLSLPQNEKAPSVDQVKSLLSQALDFARQAPTVLYSPAVPPKFKKAIKNHQVELGMDRDEVLSAKGAPDQKVRKDLSDGSEEEDWIYGQAPHVLFVIMMDGTVTKVHQY
ncbi:MAG: hypothetical protein ACRD3O_24015, partial [Terriglobia bacterium]